jgi:hypothetical protein
MEMGSRVTGSLPPSCKVQSLIVGIPRRLRFGEFAEKRTECSICGRKKLIGFASLR